MDTDNKLIELKTQEIRRLHAVHHDLCSDINNIRHELFIIADSIFECTSLAAAKGKALAMQQKLLELQKVTD